MNRTTKGAFAAGAAAVLLLGGAGSLAYWTDTDAVDGDTFTAGSMSLEALNGCDEWNLDTDEPGGQPFTPGADKLVPGDVVTKLCTFTVNAVGTHLRATVAAVPGTNSGDLLTSGPLTVGSTLAIGATPVTEITEDNDGDTLTVAVTVTFDSSSDNTSQTDSAVLGDIDIDTTQVHN